MKLIIETKTFLKSWIMAERTTNPRTPQPSLLSVHLIAKDNQVLLEATDFNTSIQKIAEGVQIVQEGEALIPLNPFSELIKKLSDQTIELTVDNTKAILTSGDQSNYQIALFDPNLFPDLSKEQNGTPFATLSVLDLNRLLLEGVVAGSLTEQFPRYVRSCRLHKTDNQLRVISTDGRRLSLSRASVDGEAVEELLLAPIEPIKDFVRFLPSDPSQENGTENVCISFDATSIYFSMTGLDYSVRRVESTFPNYERLLNNSAPTIMTVNRVQLINALDRLDLMARKNQQLVVFTLNQGKVLEMKTQEVDCGEAKERIPAQITGDSVIVGFNVAYMLDGLKACSSSDVQISFNGTQGQINITMPGSDDFLYMTMPIKLQSMQ